MAWRRSGDKPLSEPMIVYWRIYASLGLNELRYPLIYTDHHIRHHGDRASPDAFCWCKIFVNQHCDFDVKSLLQYCYVTYKMRYSSNLTTVVRKSSRPSPCDRASDSLLLVGSWPQRQTILFTHPDRGRVRRVRPCALIYRESLYVFIRCPHDSHTLGSIFFNSSGIILSTLNICKREKCLYVLEWQNCRWNLH